MSHGVLFPVLGKTVHPPLHAAILQADAVGVAAMLLTRLESARGTRDQRLAPISLALMLGRWDIARVLVAFGADYSSPGVHGVTPLTEAVANRDKAVVKFLLDNKADPSVRNEDGSSPLDVATESYFFEFAPLVIRSRTIPDFT